MVGARRITSVTAYDFTSVPIAVLSIMALGIKHPDAAICITTRNPSILGLGTIMIRGPATEKVSALVLSILQ